MDRLKRQANKYLLNPSFICFNRNCPDNYTCIRGIGENPGRGYVSYDSFPQAFLTSLQVCTLDYWEIVFNSVSTRLKNFIFFSTKSLIFRPWPKRRPLRKTNSPENIFLRLFDKASTKSRLWISSLRLNSNICICSLLLFDKGSSYRINEVMKVTRVS